MRVRGAVLGTARLLRLVATTGGALLEDELVEAVRPDRRPDPPPGRARLVGGELVSCSLQPSPLSRAWLSPPVGRLRRESRPTTSDRTDRSGSRNGRPRTGRRPPS